MTTAAPSLILSAYELRELTGSTRRATQRAELDAMGIPYRLRTDDSVVVYRAALHDAMTGKRTRTVREPQLRL